LWSDNLSARRGVRSNISKARRQFFALGFSGCFLGFSNPLSAREVVETCVISILLYGAENWILDEACLELLEHFQTEIGRRILKLSKFHSQLSVRIGLSWPSITSRILSQKLSFLCRPPMMTPLPSKPLTLLSVRMRTTSLIKQCIFLDSKLKTNFTTLTLSDIGSARASQKVMKKSISSTVTAIGSWPPSISLETDVVVCVIVLYLRILAFFSRTYLRTILPQVF